MKPICCQVCLLIAFTFFLGKVNSQKGLSTIDSLKKVLLLQKEDTNMVNTYAALTWEYQWYFPDTAIYYAITGLAVTRKLNFKIGEIKLLNSMGEALAQKANYPKALETQFKALHLSEQLNDSFLIGKSESFTGNVYFYSGNYNKALYYYRRQLQHNEAYRFPTWLIYGHLGENYYRLHIDDSAYLYLSKSLQIIRQKNINWVIPYFYLGALNSDQKNYKAALEYYRSGINISAANVDKVEGYIGLSKIFNKINQTDSVIKYAQESIFLAKDAALYSKIEEAAKILAGIYKTKNSDSAYKYYQEILTAKDSIYDQASQNLYFNEELNKQEITNEKIQLQSRLKMYALLSGLFLVFVIAIILFRNNQQKQKAKSKIEKAYSELKGTQNQLIQSEKMASLGELTAGIAHEIQNPLNFVNNFSEVNKEMVEEATEEINKGNYEEVKFILNDIKDNSEKINHHGKRADAIVKGMLQHSRKSEGTKELTDINKLCDEYIRLSYHGLRAKDKNFNADFKTEFDESMGKINVVPQDIGRVLLNLFNNAFYAASLPSEEGFSEPGNARNAVVSVSTKKINNGIEIKVSDNGPGIPSNIIDKIFQPFFTTKPTGQGTGLGLSLAYDIVKAHGGTIEVLSKENDGSVFIIKLPTLAS